MDYNEAAAILEETGQWWEIYRSPAPPVKGYKGQFIVKMYLDNEGRGATIEEAVNNTIKAYVAELRRPDMSHGEERMAWLKRYDAQRLQPATATPTGAPTAAGAGNVFNVASDKGIQSRSVWINIDGFNTLFVEASAVSKHVELVTAELAVARQQVAEATRERDAAVALVNKAHKVLRDVERNLPIYQPFDIGAHNYTHVHSAWVAGSWIRNYWLHLAEQKHGDAQATSADGEGG
jgi:hypothetical protein